MFLWLLGLVCVIVLAQVILTWVELKPYFKAKQEIRILYRTRHIGAWRYCFRNISILPKIWPACIDGLVVVLAGWVGLSGSLIGAAATMLAGFATSCLIKYNRYTQRKEEARILAGM
jgi:hypothetical protein